MSWELSIVRGETDEERTSLTQSLGESDEVRCIISSYFPGTIWDLPTNGEWGDDKGGVVEFELEGSPVTLVDMRVHDTDPSTALVAMAQEQGWSVVNDSTGGLLDAEVSVNSKSIRRLQQAAIKRRGNPSRNQQAKLSRIKKQVPLDQVEEKHGVEYRRFLQLADNEVSLDLFSLMSARMNVLRDTGQQVPFSLGGGPSEIQSPDGRRFGEIALIVKKGRKNWKLVEDYAAETSRVVGKVADMEFVLSDGTRFPTESCLFVERVWKRSI